MMSDSDSESEQVNFVTPAAFEQAIMNAQVLIAKENLDLLPHLTAFDQSILNAEEYFGQENLQPAVKIRQPPSTSKPRSKVVKATKAPKGSARAKKTKKKEETEEEDEKPVKKRTLMKEAQKKFLLAYMLNHSTFAKCGLPPGPNSAVKAAEMWKNLSDSLDSLGPKRTVSRWKQTWTEWKLRVKRKAGDLLRKETGNKNPEDKDATQAMQRENEEEESEFDTLTAGLTEQEEAIYQLFGGKDFIGAAESEEVGQRKSRETPKADIQCVDSSSVANDSVTLVGEGTAASFSRSSDTPKRPNGEDSVKLAEKTEKAKKRRLDAATCADATDVYVKECSAMTEALKECTTALMNHTMAVTEHTIAVRNYNTDAKVMIESLLSGLSSLGQSFSGLASAINGNII